MCSFENGVEYTNFNIPYLHYIDFINVFLVPITENKLLTDGLEEDRQIEEM